MIAQEGGIEKCNYITGSFALQFYDLFCHFILCTYFAGSGNPPANAFDMSGMDQSLGTLDNDIGKPKSAADFLGANANLVNLDALVTKPAPGPSKYGFQQVV